MDKIGSSSPPHKHGIYRNLMMPGFTDAGAGSSYMPKAVFPRRTAATSTRANITSVPASSNTVNTIEDGGDDDQDVDVDTRAEETFSEAGTELHDNRTKQNINNSTTRRDRYYSLKNIVVQNSGASGKGRDNNSNTTIANKNNNNTIHNNDHANGDVSGGSVEVEASFGFFPSTKPPPSPSHRRTGGTLVGGENRVDSSNEKSTKTPISGTKNSNTPLSPSPQPISPPPVTRKQLATVKRPAVSEDKQKETAANATKSSGDPRKVESESDNSSDGNNNSSQPATGTENGILQNDEHDAEQDHTQQQQPLHERPFVLKREMKREVSTFSLAAEIGDGTYKLQKDEDETTTEQHRQSQPQRINEMEERETESGNDCLPTDTKDSCDDNDETCNHGRNTNNVRLNLKALQEIDRMENQEQMKGLQSLYNGNGTKTKARKVDRIEDELIDKNNATNDHDDEGSLELSTSSSIVSSTCSEFGTVVQMGVGTLAERMKEVEEMEAAAFAEAEIEENDTEHQTKASQLSSTSLLKHETSLDLPILDLSSSDQKDAATTKHDKLEAGLQPKAGKIEYLQSGAKTTFASANLTMSPKKQNPTKSEMVSAAFRRIGPIHSLNNNIRGDKNTRNALSAPSTPMRMPPPNYSKKMLDTSVEGQESSCYETGSDIVGDKKNSAILSPRFASFLRGRGNKGAASSIAETKTTAEAKAVSQPIQLSPRVAISQTFQYAQKCLSHDNTLTEYGDNGYDCDIDFKNDHGIDERRRKLQEDLVIPPLGQRPISSRLAPRVLPLESSSSIRNGTGARKLSRPLRYSHSLDSSSNRRSPFRELPSSTSHRFRFLNNSFPAPTNEANTSSSVAIPDPTSTSVDLRGRINSDFSPTKYSKNIKALNSTMELKQPQRIETERDDALNILACLVEQGNAYWNTSTKIQNIDPASINLHNHDDLDTGGKSSDLNKNSAAKEEKTGEGISQTPRVDPNDNLNNNRSESDSDLHELIEDFKAWIQEHDDENNQSTDNGTSKRYQWQRRMEILQDLVKSHAYAVEMKRASTSASTWLKSIGRGQSASKHEILGNVEELQLKATKISADATEVESCKKNESTTTNKMETLTLKATLHSAQLELTETKQVNLMLNEELSKCRAEIGRMKSISRSDHLNKSILDDSEISSDTSFSETRLKESSANSITRNPGKDEEYFQGVSSKEARERIESTGELDVIVLQTALEKANETIRSLHSDLCKNKVVEDGKDMDPAPVVDIPERQVKENQPQSTTSTPDSTRQTVNVHMLDGENFVTDWDDLRALPPPPDHSLQSPIVSTVLEQWTQDRSLHESLLSWMDNVMRGNDLDGLPPLTISSLDHQVRDGFTMHVLPHLLRRADIHVGVQTRTHRQTTYDMSVIVSQKKEFMTESSKVLSSVKSQQQPSLLDRRDSMSGDEWGNRFEPRISSAESVAHSAVTDTIANLPATPQIQPGVISDPWGEPPQTPLQSEYLEFSSRLRSPSGSADTFDENSQHYRQRQSEHNQGGASNGTIMGALGGALSGLLSRNKYAVSPGRFHPSQTQYRPTGFAEDSRDTSNMLPASLRAQMDLTSSPTPGSTGYHRVGPLEATVSAAIDDQRQHQEEEPQPYHRVVSAPPGRIGVTFVEFRGHAMVSDVAMDSPLGGWVFPSDILIAVDEIPVSGMRVRDIVTILSDRKNRQRAMRVISSHAMNEFTMMSQVSGSLIEENGEDE